MANDRHNQVQVPCNLSLPRAWKWCVMATMRDLRTSAAHGYAISLPNLRRLYIRRWADACYLHDLAMDTPTAMELCAVGRRYVVESYRQAINRAWRVSDDQREAA